MEFYKYIVARTLIENFLFLKVYDGLIPHSERGKSKTPFAILKNFEFTIVESRTIGSDAQCYDIDLEFDTEIWHKHIVLAVEDDTIYQTRAQTALDAQELLLDIKDFQPWGLVTGRNPGVTTSRREEGFAITTFGVKYEIAINETLGLTTEQQYFDSERFDLETEDL